MGSQLRVLDMLGRERRKQPAGGGTSNALLLTGLAPGAYVVQWLDNAGRILSTKRLVVAAQ